MYELKEKKTDCFISEDNNLSTIHHIVNLFAYRKDIISTGESLTALIITWLLPLHTFQQKWRAYNSKYQYLVNHQIISLTF